MRLAILAAIALTVSSAEAQSRVSPLEPFAGQTIDDAVCEPAGSTRTMSVCYVLWRAHEEALLRQSFDRLLARAREQETHSPLFQGVRGYVDSVTRGQANWLEWRNNECELATVDDVAGSIRQLSYPGCQARLTAQRRERLDALLTFWQNEFRDVHGEASGATCVLQPEAFPHCRP
jgi:uncharacterized protein YecT (DUF1311 family)